MNGYFETASNPEVIKPEKKLITLCHYPIKEANEGEQGKETGE